jgi:uncharacterized protein (TIGR00730 family)
MPGGNGAARNGSPDPEELIHGLIEAAGGSAHAEFLEGMIRTVLRLIKNRTSRGDIKILNASLRELVYAFKVFGPYRGVRKVTMFGSARTPEDSPVYRQAVAFARAMSARSWMVMTGAGDGIMKAGHDGAGRAGSFGLNIRLPFEQSANAVIRNDAKLITFRYFFTRKLLLVKETDAIALFPGGFGTMDETFEILTLIQTGKSNPVPIVCLDEPGGDYWQAWDEYVRRALLGRGLICPSDLRLYRVTDRLEEAVEEVLGFYRNYHSSRYVDDRLVLRVQHAPSAEELERLNREFGDILVADRIRLSSALVEEANEPALAELPRLVLFFNRRDIGRLRELIDAVNRLPVPPETAEKAPAGRPAGGPRSEPLV